MKKHFARLTGWLKTGRTKPLFPSVFIRVHPWFNFRFEVHRSGRLAKVAGAA